MGARLVSMESEGENDFVMENLLWIGFLGEAYTGERISNEVNGASQKRTTLFTGELCMHVGALVVYVEGFKPSRYRYIRMK